jgi:hypothetical protein
VTIWLSLLSLILGAAAVGVVVLSVHDQQTISTLKSMHARLKKLEGRE